jgi:hypothetical protein
MKQEDHCELTPHATRRTNNELGSGRRQLETVHSQDKRNMGQIHPRRIGCLAREQFVKKLQEKYGHTREEAEKELDEHLSKW